MDELIMSLDVLLDQVRMMKMIVNYRRATPLIQAHMMKLGGIKFALAMHRYCHVSDSEMDAMITKANAEADHRLDRRFIH